MRIKTKAWIVSQGLLVLTAVLIQLTFYREIKLGPLLGMTKRPYWEIIYDRPPDIPGFVREKQLPPKCGMPGSLCRNQRFVWLSWQGIEGHTEERKVYGQPFWGGWLVNGLYLILFHSLCWYIPRQAKATKQRIA